MEDDVEDKSSNSINNNLLIEAIMANMEKLMNEKFENLRLENSNNNQNREKKKNHSRNQYDQEAKHSYYFSSHSGERRQIHAHDERDFPRNNFHGSKTRIPSFHGTNESDLYLDWEKEMERVFSGEYYSEQDKVRVAARTLFDYAANWWDQLVTTRKRLGVFPIESWAEMKFIMRQRYASRYCHRKLQKDCEGVKRVKAVEKNFHIQRQEQNQPSPIHQKSMREKENVKRSTTTQEKLENEMLELLNFYRKSMKAKCVLPSKSVKDKCAISTEKSDFALESNQACEKLILYKPVQPSIIESFSQVLEEKSPEEAQRGSPSIKNMEQPTSPTPEPLFKMIPKDSSQKHCKEIDLVRKEPIFFVMVSAQDEKRFCLEKVKEFCVSKSVFDKMIPTFEKLTPETFLKQKSFLIDEPREFHSSLSVSEFTDISELLRSRTEPILYKTLSNVKQMLNTSLCISESFYESRIHLESVSNVLGYKSKFSYHKNLFDSSRTFDVVSLVFLKAHEKQVKDAIPNTWTFNDLEKPILKEIKEKFQENPEWPSPKSFACSLKEREATLQPLHEEKDHFLWPHKKKGDVKRRCQSYVICKWTNTQPHGLHHSILIPLHSWNEISFGFVGLSRIRMDKDYIVLNMKMFSKVFHFISFHKTSVNLHHAHLIIERITRSQSFLTIKLDLFDVFHESKPSFSNPLVSNEIASSLSVSNFNEVFMLFRTESKYVWYKVFSKMKLMLKFVLCAFKWFDKLEKHLESVLEDMNRNVTCLTTLLAFSCCIYDGFLVVFVDFYKGQDSCYGKGQTRTTKPSRWSKSEMEPGDCVLSNTLKYIFNRAYSKKCQGKFKSPQSMNDYKDFPLVSGKADLRSNLFQEGGDDMIMDRQLERELGAKEQLEPEDVQGALELPDGPITRSKAKKLNQAISTLLNQAESNLSEIAYPTTLVVIQAN